MHNNPLRNRVALAVGLTAVALLGVTAYAAVTNVLAVGTIPHSELLGGPAAVTVRTISFAPQEVGAWHYHPGPLFNVVTRGTVTVEDGCGGDEATFAYQTFVIPLGQPTTINVPGNERRCGPARSINECKDGGWANFTHPRSFGSQGDCMQFVLNGE